MFLLLLSFYNKSCQCTWNKCPSCLHNMFADLFRRKVYIKYMFWKLAVNPPSLSLSVSLSLMNQLIIIFHQSQWQQSSALTSIINVWKHMRTVMTYLSKHFQRWNKGGHPCHLFRVWLFDNSSWHLNGRTKVVTFLWTRGCPLRICWAFTSGRFFCSL